ncbi:nucleoside-triphosphatase [Lacinutrix salivirga]
MKSNTVYIISDAKRSGKTTALQTWLKDKTTISGFLSPVVNGKRIFFNIENKTFIPMETNNKDLKIGNYAFDNASFKHVEETILTLWEAKSTKCIVLDEIGPLEIESGLGFHNLILHLSKTIDQNKPDLLFVVRDYCLDRFLNKYPFKKPKIMTVKQFENRRLFKL